MVFCNKEPYAEQITQEKCKLKMTHWWTGEKEKHKIDTRSCTESDPMGDNMRLRAEFDINHWFVVNVM